MGLSRTMGPSSGPRSLSIKDVQIKRAIDSANDSANEFFRENSANAQVVKKEIDGMLLDMKNNHLFDVIMSMNRGSSSDKNSNQTQALIKLKQDGVKKFILDFDKSNSDSEEYASKVAYIQTLFNALKTQFPEDDWVVSYETSSPVVETDMLRQIIDAKIDKLKPGFFGSFGYPFGGRKQKRTKKGGKKSKRKTKRHKKTRSRRR
jgi:hypothetical protein